MKLNMLINRLITLGLVQKDPMWHL